MSNQYNELHFQHSEESRKHQITIEKAERNYQLFENHIKNLIQERDELLTNSNVSIAISIDEIDKLLLNFKHQNKAYNQLLQERDQLIQDCDQLLQERNQCFEERIKLIQERDQLSQDFNVLKSKLNTISRTYEHQIQILKKKLSEAEHRLFYFNTIHGIEEEE